MKKIVVILLLLSLTACAGPIKPAVGQAPANLTIPCPDLLLLAEGSNMGDLLLADIELAGQYYECAARHRGLVKWAETVTKP